MKTIALNTNDNYIWISIEGENPIKLTYKEYYNFRTILKTFIESRATLSTFKLGED